MTWSSKVIRVVLAVGVLGAVVLAVGANYLDFGGYWFW